jgi:Flp pilus assembly protein TadG
MTMRNLSSRLIPSAAMLTTQQEGNSLIETALVLPILLLLLVGAVDIGRGFRAAMIVNAAARTGAASGIHHPTDIAGMQVAAKSDSSSIVNVTPVATYGCECADDSSKAVALCSSGPSCSFNSVYYVEVDTSATYTPMLPWLGFSQGIPLKEKVRLRAGR